MPHWECSIEGCGETFGDVESAIVHQTDSHERTECKVCGTVVPDGYFAIRHAFDEHSRAEYVRAYGASATDVRLREEIKDAIEATVDLQAVIEHLDGSSPGTFSG